MIDRCCRLLVPFVPVLVAVALLNRVVPISDRGQIGINRGVVAFLGNLFLLNDYPLLQAASHSAHVEQFYVRSYNSAEPFWTLPLEFWIYVVFALLFFGLLRRERISWALGVPLLAVALPVFLWNSFAGGSGVLVMVWLLGSAFAYFWVMHLENAPNRVILGWLMIAFGALGLLGRMAKVGYRDYEFQQDTFIAFIVFGALCCLPNRAGETVPGKWTSRLAAYSYSLYLVHNSIIIVIDEHLGGAFRKTTALVLALATSHIVAFLFYLAFERHYTAVSRWLKERAFASPRAALGAGQ